MDEMAKVIEQELRDCVDGPPRPGCSGNAERIAAAVRTFLVSDGVVERVALAIKNERRRFMGFTAIPSLGDLKDHQKRDELRMARVVALAISGGDCE